MRDTAGDSVGKSFARHLERLGIEGRKTLHSARSTFTTKLHEAGVKGEIVRRLTGHAGDDVHEQRYLQAIALPVLQEAIERLDVTFLRQLSAP